MAVQRALAELLSMLFLQLHHSSQNDPRPLTSKYSNKHSKKYLQIWKEHACAQNEQNGRCPELRWKGPEGTDSLQLVLRYQKNIH